MKLREKIFVVVLGILIFIVSGGIACTYFTSGLNLLLVGALGVLVFVAAGYLACTYSQNRIAKRKASQITP